jgi:hypothetical protein|tara:strand:+ start:69 stop:1034 length:966 start_codon:yes stop_codon:yes gene_type:complete
MSIFSAFNQLSSKINSSFSNVSRVSSTINNFTSSLNRTTSLVKNFDSSGGFSNTFGQISNIAGSMKNNIGQVDSIISRGGNLAQAGAALRMIGNSAQQVGYNAAPPTRKLLKAIISSNITAANDADWRVRISVPTILSQDSVVLAPLIGTGNSMVFPFTPTVLVSNSANYSQVQPVHTNFPYNSYENSQVDAFTITGEFVNESTDDGEYFIAALHFLRSATKMFYSGDDATTGLPPVVCRLNGYGQHVLNNIPVVITNFTTDLPNDVDYIRCVVDGKENFVPSMATITVTATPQYARRSQARFSLTDFAKGGFVGKPEGFV